MAREQKPIKHFSWAGLSQGRLGHVAERHSSIVQLNTCPSCGEYTQGKLTHMCNTEVNRATICIGISEEGSPKCQEQIEDSKIFCLGCSKKFGMKLKKEMDEMKRTLNHEEVMNLIQSLPNEPGRTKEEMSELRRIASGGVIGVIQFIESMNNSWKDVSLNIGVIGQSGSGKSTFINTIRGVKKGKPGYAPVGVTETTTCIKEYPHPENPNLIFSDVPGVGTPNYPKEEYLKKIAFEKYDFFLILSAKRFRTEDSWLAKEVEESDRSFFFVRTHIDSDVANDKREDREHHSKEKVLETVRTDCEEHLQKAKVKSAEIFLIDNHEINDYDFASLTERLLDSRFSDDMKRNAFILSLSFLTKKLIEEKRKALKGRMWRVALISAISGNIPTSDINTSVYASQMIDEFNVYRSQFGLTDEHLQHATQSKIAVKLRTKYANYMANINIMFTFDELIETALKHGIPFIGKIVSGLWSYFVNYGMLCMLLDEVVKDATMLREEAISLVNLSE